MKNYRTLEDALILFGDHYCTISGKNNAGKSSIIRLLTALFRKEDRPWKNQYDINFNEDKTQWVSDKELISIEYHLILNKSDDSSLVNFVKKLCDITSEEDLLNIVVRLSYGKDDLQKHSLNVDGKEITGTFVKDILHKFKTSNLLFLHNSTSNEEIYIGTGRGLSLVELVLSPQEKQNILDTEKQIQVKIKKFAKQHKNELQGLFEKLGDKHSVEFSTFETGHSRHIPLGIRLADKNVSAPIAGWGSGTQNKTHILLSILWANRIKTQGADNEKITPIVIIEEPESFLHPSAQAEFGKLLSTLAPDLGIQIIVTTHSPYMLNRNHPQANILAQRSHKDKTKYATEIVIPNGDDWMLPFAEHLGIPSREFVTWSGIFHDNIKKILLVEGSIDKAYLEFIQKNKLLKETLPEDLEIVPYGGKDALKNTVLLKFTLAKYQESYITMDLDAVGDVKRAIEAIGYQENISYFAIGVDQPGHQDIEGLLPERIRSTIFAENISFVTKALGGDKESKDKLKKLFVAEFLKHTDYTDAELKGFSDLFKRINKGIKENSTRLKKQL